MALAARERGYEYLAITDHSASHGFGNDVSPDELRRQIARIAEIDAGIEGIRLLAGSEVNILPDGSLDYEDQLLEQLDWVVASVHTAFGIGEQRMTERIIAAIEHPLVDAIGHPTGRLIERRTPYAVDLEAVFAAAARTATLLEINANPDRRDLSETHARAAVAAGAGIVIDSDAHQPATLANMRWGILTARRGWLGAADVANTRSRRELERSATQPPRPPSADTPNVVVLRMVRWAVERQLAGRGVIASDPHTCDGGFEAVDPNFVDVFHAGARGRAVCGDRLGR